MNQTLDEKFVGALLDFQEAAFPILRDENFKEDYVNSKVCRDILVYVKDFYGNFGEAPAVGIIEKKFNFTYQKPEQGLSFYIAEMRRRKQFELTANLANSIAETYNTSDKERLRNGVENSVKDVLEVSRRLITEFSSARTVDLTVDFKSRIELYKEAKRNDGIIGIPTYWPTLTRRTRGLQRSHVYMVAGKEGTGKTFFLLLNAIAAWEAGLKVLFFTEEMSADEIGLRFDALSAKIPYGKLLDGSLSDEEERMWLEHVESRAESESRFMVNEGGARYGFDYVEELVDQIQPDLVIIDSAYKYSSKGTDREALNILSGRIKSCAMRNRVPFLISMQENEKGDAYGSRGFNFDATHYWRLFFDEEHEKMVILDGKSRDAARAVGKCILASEWDFEFMCFDENIHYSMNDVVEDL